MEAAQGIAKALEKHPELKEALWKDLFTGRMKTEIPIALKAMGQGMITAGAQLTVLDCSDNALGPNGMTGLVDLLQSTACYTLQVSPGWAPKRLGCFVFKQPFFVSRNILSFLKIWIFFRKCPINKT